jgi:hypothetical protein
MSDHDHDHDHGDDHDHEGGHGDVAVEESGLPNLSIAGFVGLTALVFFTSAATLPSLFYRIVDRLKAEQTVQSSELGTLRAYEVERLSTYGYVDQAKGIVHIPIDVAMQKVIEDAKK